MQQPENEEIRWLTLSEAAKSLNVHPVTLRRWADEGQIPVMRTPGGHRRFAASDIANISERHHQVPHIGPVERIWASRALENTRAKISEHQDDHWLGRLDDQSRSTHRQLGQQLLDLVLNYLTGDDAADLLIGEARKIGRRYGEISDQNGLTLTDVLRAFMIFRDTLVKTAIELPADVSIPPSSQMLLIGRISEMLNTVQLGIAESYEGASGSQPGEKPGHP